jgi:hypothetical protein
MDGKLAIATRCNSQQPDKGASHSIDAAKSRSRGHMLEAFTGAFDLTSRCLHAHLKYVLGRSRSNLSRKYALEISHAHRHPIR